MGIQGSHLHFLNIWIETKSFDSHLQNVKPSRARPLVLSYNFLNAWIETKSFDSHLQNAKPSRAWPLVLSYNFLNVKPSKARALVLN
jgi:hypothetical protein